MSSPRTITVLALMVALALPGWTMRDCCCARREATVQHERQLAKLPPCCAARAKQRAGEQDSVPRWTAVCECRHDVTPSVVATMSRAEDSTAPQSGNMAVLSVRVETIPVTRRIASRGVASPGDLCRPNLTRLCRLLA